MKNKWYLIKNYDNFIDHARSLVFKYFGEYNQDTENTDDLADIMLSFTDSEKLERDNLISLEECEIISRQFIKQKFSKKDKKIKYYITDTRLEKMLESFNSRMVSNILNKLVNDGLLESAFDEQSNDFIFWVKDNEKEAPETD